MCIIDDREDVWSHAANLIHVKPYHFFQHTGDINAPPGLDKHESDNKEGVDLTKVNNETQKKSKLNGSVKETKVNGTQKEEIKILEKEKCNNDSNDTERDLITTEEKCDPENGNNEESTSNNCIKENTVTDEGVQSATVQKMEKEEQSSEVSKEEEPKVNCDTSSTQTVEIVNNENKDEVEKAISLKENILDNGEDKSASEVKEMILDNVDDKNMDEKVKENILDNGEDKKADEMEEVILNNEEIMKEDEIKEVRDNEENKKANEIKEASDNEDKKIDEVNEIILDNEEDKKADEVKENNDSAMGENDKNNEVQNKFKQYSNNDIDNEQKDDELIEIEDPDDYLLYLEDILKTIHNAFYDNFDKLEAGKVPDLKKVIPEVRRNVLKGTKLVFSGLVPTHIKLEQSKAYQVARSLGATVTQDLEESTTHLVAVRPGTAKVNAGRRKKGLKIVTPDWLWACAERWTKVEEKLYTLNNKGSKNRHPPPHCSSPEHNANFDIQDAPVRKRTPSGRFMDTINPLMSFSSADIADMDREVEDIFNESESDGESGTKKNAEAENDDNSLLNELKKTKESDEESSSSDESLTGEHPHGWRPTRTAQKRCRDDQEGEDESTADEFPSTKFRRGEQLSSDLDIGQDSNSEGSVDAPDEIDDGDWNMMGAALEREFLANN